MRISGISHHYGMKIHLLLKSTGNLMYIVSNDQMGLLEGRCNEFIYHADALVKKALNNMDRNDFPEK